MTLPTRLRAAAAPLVAVLIITALTAAAAHAYRVLPIRLQLPAETGARGAFIVENTQPDMIAVQAEVFIQRQGRTPDMAPAPEDFIVTPPQMVLEAGERQTVRVQWIGEEIPERELAYRVVFEQIPVPETLAAPDGERRGRVRTAYTYSTAVYVTPEGGEAALEFVSARPVEGEDGERKLEVRVRNSGERRTNILEPELRLSAPGGGGVVLSGEDLGPINGGLLHAGAEVTVLLDWPDGLEPGPLTGDIRARLTIV